MKKSRKKDPAFRFAFTLLVGGAILLLFWKCAQRPAGPSRIDWPADAGVKP